MKTTPFYFFVCLLTVASSVLSGPALTAADGGNLIIAGDIVGEPNTVEFVNYVVKADIFYNAGYFGGNTTIANVEGGHIWGGHEVFDRSGFGLPSVSTVMIHAPLSPEEAPQLGEYDFHATMVGHVLAGTGDAGNGSLSYHGIGMAPFAGLWSGAIATSFSGLGSSSFSFDHFSFVYPYAVFFEGLSEHGRPDVINSSWGGSGGGSSLYTRVIDSLAGSNPTVTSVIAAGNAGPDAGTIFEPATGMNSIVVGALAAAQFPGQQTGSAEFSSRGPANFYNPETGELIENVRAAVHIAAPGQHMALAAYLGNSGGLTGHEVATDNPPDNLYFAYNMSGTSFAAPVVAGGVALLKDVAKGGVYLVGVDHALDSRVMRSVIMAGAVKTPGWDNGQSVADGVIVTEQGLDFATGAGGLDLERAVIVYAFGTTDLSSYGGGVVSSIGWDFGTVGLGLSNDYIFGTTFAPYTELTIALNWFANQDFDVDTLGLVEGTASFANLDLEVWGLTNGVFTDLIAASVSLYNSSEFLRIVLEAGGQYGFRVKFDDIVYDLTGLLDEEHYAVAWMTALVPEPAAVGFVIGVLCLLAVGMRRRGKAG